MLPWQPACIALQQGRESSVLKAEISNGFELKQGIVKQDSRKIILKVRE